MSNKKDSLRSERPKLNIFTQNKFDQLQIGDFLIVKNSNGDRIISHMRISEISESEVVLVHAQSRTEMRYSPEEVQDLNFCRIIE